jgi:hypothetical protein
LFALGITTFIVGVGAMLTTALELYPEPVLVITMFVTAPLLICEYAAAP